MLKTLRADLIGLTNLPKSGASGAAETSDSTPTFGVQASEEAASSFLQVSADNGQELVS
jgi:hypothetical protein